MTGSAPASLLFAALIALCAATGALAQDAPPVAFPQLGPAAADAKGFAPPGSVVETQTTGDIDGDGAPDLVFVLHQTAKANIVANPDGPGSDSLDTNPRILGVALGAGAGKPYRLIVQNHILIPRHEAANLSDAFDGLKTGRNAFDVNLELFANAGGTDTSRRRFTFRVQAGRCLLIGYDEVATNRYSGALVHTSINYLVGRRVVETSTIESDAPPKVRNGKLKPGPLMSLDAIGDGIDFEPKP